MAADRAFVSREGVVPTPDLLREGGPHTLKLNRLMIDGVVEAPLGAHFTECPDYERDERAQRLYVDAADDPISGLGSAPRTRPRRGRLSPQGGEA